MEFVTLGKTQIKCSKIIFGAWAIGGSMWGGTDEKAAIEAIQASLDNGITTIDTAPVYGMGLSEELIAKAIKGRRDKVVIATKCGLRWDSKEGSDPWETTDAQGNPVTIMTNGRPASIFKECEDSLRRLSVDYIDLLQIHWPDGSFPISESWEALVKLKMQGKVRAIGVSNFNLQQLKEANEIHPVDTLQSPYSLLRTGLEQDLIPYCKKNHITTLAYSPLERGLLTGKVTEDRKFKKSDHRSTSELFSTENRRRILESLMLMEPIARKYDATLSQLVIATTLALNTIDTVIVGARNATQAKENALASRIKLTKDELEFVHNTLTPHTIEMPV